MAWWNDAWPYRVPVTIDTSAVGETGSVVNNAPVLIRLHSANFEDFFMVKEDLGDLRFINSDDKTPLKFHVESLDLLNQLAFIWVQLPELPLGPTPTRIWMYYGNLESAKAEDAVGTFDVSQVAAFHFANPTGAPTDLTGYKTPVVSFEGAGKPASLIGAGVTFTEVTGGLLLADTPATRIVPSNGYAASFWVNPAASSPEELLFQKGDALNNMAIVSGQGTIFVRLTQNGQVIESAKATFSAGVWQQIALVVSQTTATLFVNGIPGTPLSASLIDIGGQTMIGGAINKQSGFKGELDEVRIYNSALPNNLIATEAKNQSPLSAMVTPGPGEQLGNASGNNFFITIFQNTGTEGWVVIGLLAIMAVLSWVVMFLKMLFIGRIKKDNRAFLKQYEQLNNLNIASLDADEDGDFADQSQAEMLFGKHDHFQASPLYHIYHRGIKETKDRIEANSGKQNVMNETAVNSLRAGLEAYVVREIQGLNRNMVLLTIAVSGGPFLGLLGTVVGVMITFAAIAATGDVNIAAIAPGVAAALLTTVAGLVVAIPALFGYNWLTTQIKDMIADMHLFTEELVNKLAERYDATKTSKADSTQVAAA